MENLPKPEKPYRFDTIPKAVTATDYAMWESTLWDYLKSIKSYRKLLKKDLTWTHDEDDNRGMVDDVAPIPEPNRVSAEDKALALESIILKIATYGPKSIFIDVTKRLKSYKEIFAAIKRVSGFPVQGVQLIQYMCVKNSFDIAGKESYNDFYWRLRDEKIASLMTRESGIKYRGRVLDNDEEITPSVENQVVVDWLEAIGGIKLVKFVGQEYAKELEKTSIYDLQETLGNQEVMKSILEKMNSEEVAKLNRTLVQKQLNSQKQQRKPFERERQRKDKSFLKKKEHCYICEELGNGNENSHDTADCNRRKKNKRAKGFTATVKDEKKRRIQMTRLRKRKI